MSKFAKFFASEQGRKTVFVGSTAITLSLFAGNFFPHTFLLNKYREIVTCYNSGIEKPVPENIKLLVEKAYEKLDLHPYYRKIIKPFSVYGFDIFEAGSTKFRFGAALGIPINFSYESEKDIDRQQVHFRNKPINWSSHNGKLLQESLILTEDEKLFALCKAILQLDTHRVLLNSVYPTLTFFIIYAIGNSLNQKLKLLSRPMQIRVVMYSILGLFGLGSWAFLKDFTQVRYDATIDKKLSELGPEFVEAGVTYYEKILKRNIALRNLIGDNTFTAKGNENFFLRQKHLPLTFRKSYFETKLSELKQENELKT